MPQIVFAASLSACGAMCGPAWGQTTQPASAPATAIVELVAQLGDNRWAVREAAHRQLLATRDRAVIPALRQAATSDDLERALRARELLAELLDFTHVVLDALGEPIADAQITLISAERSAPTVILATNMFGGVTLPPLWNRPQGQLRFYHKQFGWARGPEPYRQPRQGTAGAPLPPTPICVPMVAKDSPAYERALRGQVVGADGKGVPGAEVVCQQVRVPNQGSFSGSGNMPNVLTDDEGRFAVYPPNANPRGERGALIPLHSQFLIHVRPPAGTGLFPYGGEHDNAAQALVQMARPERFHRFEFETDDGRTNPTNYLSLVYRPTPSVSIPLDGAYLREGGKLMPGTYLVQGGQFVYPPLEVTKDSPEVLVFRLPPPRLYSGRVLDGATGKPLAGAFVIAYSGGRGEYLAMMKDSDWKVLEALPAGASKDVPALNTLRRYWNFRTLCRTDEQGRYEISERTGVNFTGVLAFARDRLPCSVNTANSGRSPEDKSPLCDLPLFPAARINLQPTNMTNLPASPEWEFSPEGQPEWFDRFRAVLKGPATGAQIACRSWLQPNQPQSIYVPAGVRLTLVLQVPTNEAVSSARVNGPIQLAPGASLDVGPVAFERALSVTVRVTGPEGNPVQNVPVQQLYVPDRPQPTGVRFTDANGQVRFSVQKNSHGYFTVPSPMRAGYARAHAGRATVPFQIDADAPAGPLSLPLTADQAQPFPVLANPLRQ